MIIRIPMPQYVITPWKFHSELLQIRRELYQLGDASLDRRRHAIDWIAAWKQRGALPHAVESTALLVDAVLHHDARINTTFSIRATYSAAFCRFVTGYCDIAQRTAIRKSMFEVAQEIDMPASFVELRHEATHEELPSLQRLQRNTRLALDWLWQSYWAKLDDPFDRKDVSVTQDHIAPTTERLQLILNTFSAQRRAEIKASSDDTTATSASGIACLELVKLCRGSKESVDMLCSLLLGERMLIPSGRRLGKPMTGAFLIFSNLLRRLTYHVACFARQLLSAMVTLLATPSALDISLDTFREAIAAWILQIFVKGKLWRQARVQRKVEKCRALVIAECVASPNVWTVKVARGLVMGKAVDEEFQLQWKVLVDTAALLVEEG